jgi:hypothetical protein
MAFKFDASKAIVPVRTVTRRVSCHTLEGAMQYIGEEVEEAKKKKEHKWIKDLVVRVSLHSMPFHWDRPPAIDGKGRPIGNVVIKDANLEKIGERPAVFGATMYPVSSFDEGVELLELLSSGSDADLNNRLKEAAEALRLKDTEELPAIDMRASMLYAEKGLVETMGEWGEPDEKNEKTGRMKVSTRKTNKMNQYKQTARRQMGYGELYPTNE